MDFALGRVNGADGTAVRRKAPQEPLPVPQRILAGCLHFLQQRAVGFHILLTAQMAGCIQEMLRGPHQQEGYHGTFAAAQVEAVVPVRPQALCDAVSADLAVGEVQPPLHVVPDGILVLIGIGDHLVEEGDVPGLPHIFDDRGQ